MSQCLNCVGATVNVGSYILEVVNKFHYLGSDVTSDYEHLLLPRKTKLSKFVLPVLAEYSNLTSDHEGIPVVFEEKCCKRSLRALREWRRYIATEKMARLWELIERTF